MSGYFGLVPASEALDMALKIGKKYDYGGDPEGLAARAVADLVEKWSKGKLEGKGHGYIWECLDKSAEMWNAEVRYQQLMDKGEALKYTAEDIKGLLRNSSWKDCDDTPNSSDGFMIEGMSLAPRGITRDPMRVWARLSDLREAWKGLTESHRTHILSVHRDGKSSGGKPRYGEAIEMLTRQMNIRVNQTRNPETPNGKWGDGPGARKTISNGEAQYATGREDSKAPTAKEPNAEWMVMRQRDPGDPPGTWFDWWKYQR